MSSLGNASLLLGRVLASVIFIIGGYGKLMGMAGTMGYFAKIGVPLPDIAYYVAVAVELGGGLLLLVGFQARIVASVLAVFCVATALLAHTSFADMGQQTLFLKNLAMAGGFLAFAVAGAGAYSVDGRSSAVLAK